MTYVLFDYKPGHIEARFSHEPEFDFIELRIRMTGDITTTTECDKHGRKTEPVSYQKETVDFTVYISSVFCPFKDFIRFLEAITLDVQECAFGWDPEGPEGRMHWLRRSPQDTGFLTVEWVSSKKNFSHRMMLNTRETVSTLYLAFRAFVDSPEYDPLRYEELNYGECFALVLSDASLGDLAGRLAEMNADTVERVLQSLANSVDDRHMKGPKLSFPIKHSLEASEPVEPSSKYEWVDPEWDTWDTSHRMIKLEEIFSWGGMSWYGHNLRQMRSKLIEDWLSLPEAVAARTNTT
ncbi:hypothetical protein [Nitrosospira multiformis]|uniref:Uncharacterized protein n=1 Tax=Nitrosospira multiformis TaxID=1231 RepID=A0A1I7IKW3_9PROT|nr:hypothetical protein [Nitrosospira multiformis]SFU73526.1 hypothetical protein SAMN05216417_1216 [Nitrosospira multiformis]